jgi:hypothetical protein
MSGIFIQFTDPFPSVNWSNQPAYPLRNAAPQPHYPLSSIGGFRTGFSVFPKIREKRLPPCPAAISTYLGPPNPLVIAQLIYRARWAGLEDT